MLARVCRPWDVPQVPERLAAFLEKGYHGQMGWMAERAHWRGAPAGAVARGAIGDHAGGELYAGA